VQKALASLLLAVLSAGCLALSPLQACAQPGTIAVPVAAGEQPPPALQADWAQWLTSLAGLGPEAALAQLRQAPDRFTALADYHYWLGVYLQASQHPLTDVAAEFELALLTDPSHAGAWFDYGLVQCRLGQASSCQSILVEARRRFGTPPAVPESRPPSAPWHGEVRVGLGHSSNYNLGSSSQTIPIQLGPSILALELDPAYRPIAAAYQRVELDLAYRSVLQPALEARVSLMHRSPLRLKDVLSNYDSAALDLIWQARPAHYFSAYLQTLRDSELGSFQMQGLRWRYLRQDAQADTVWIAAVERRQPVAPQSSYNTMAAQVRRAGSYSAGGSYYAALGAEQDLPQDQRPGSSQTRLQFSAGLEQANLLPGRATARLSLRLVQIRDAQAYSPLFGNIRRQNTQADMALALRWPLANTSYLQAELRRFVQHSNLALFSQSDMQLNLDLGYRF
jgi:hypothetical protein